MTRRRTLVTVALLGAVVSTVLAPLGHARGETPITTCGQVVRTNALLTRDLGCAGRAGVVVGASGITINLNGFTVHGDRSSGRYGIDDLNGFDRVTVENGVVRNFDYGLVGFGANRLVVSGLVVSGNTSGGIFVVGSTPQIQSSKALRNGEDGIYVLGTSATVQSSTGSANAGSGIYVSGAFSRIRSIDSIRQRLRRHRRRRQRCPARAQPDGGERRHRRHLRLGPPRHPGLQLHNRTDWDERRPRQHRSGRV